MFKPVQGQDLAQFDDETRALFAKRENDPRLSYVLATIVRRNRHSLPVVVDDENPLIQNLENQRRNFKYHFTGMALAFGFAANRFTKAYYPYGLIVRRSIPTTPLRQASYFGPILAFYAYAWWMHKEYPRRFKTDLTCDSEN